MTGDGHEMAPCIRISLQAALTGWQAVGSVRKFARSLWVPMPGACPSGDIFKGIFTNPVRSFFLLLGVWQH
jgi:hypothetical protein